MKDCSLSDNYNNYEQFSYCELISPSHCWCRVSFKENNHLCAHLIVFTLWHYNRQNFFSFYLLRLFSQLPPSHQIYAAFLYQMKIVMLPHFPMQCLIIRPQVL